MKVLLVKAVTKYPPIGLAYLAAKLETININVSIIDYVIERYIPDTFRAKLRDLKPDLVGIKILSFETKPSFEIARMTKEIFPDCPVVMGGPHATGLPKETLESEYVDFVVVGEGEETLAELVISLRDGLSLEKIKGLGYKLNGSLYFNPPREYIKDIDSILFPTYYLLPLDLYFESPDPHGMVTRHKRYMPVLTSRGCPFKCVYCQSTFGRVFRGRSPENVADEIELLYNKYRIREIHIEDDSFNVDIGRAKRILDLIVERDLNITLQFPNGLRADRLDEELIKKLKKAGTSMMAIGIESGSPKVLKSIKKGLELSKVPKVINLAVKHGILVWGYFMIGFWKESLKEIEETINFARKLKLHFASFSIVIPFPGTELFKTVKQNLNIDSYFSRRLTYSRPQIQLSEVPLSEIGEIKKKALRKFYTPWRILRIIPYIHNIKELKFYWEKFKKNILFPKFGSL